MGIFIPFVFKLFTHIAVVMKCLSDLPYNIIKDITDSIKRYNTKSSMHFSHVIECLRNIDFTQINTLPISANENNETTPLIADIQWNVDSKIRLRSMLRFNRALKTKMLILMLGIAFVFLIYLIITISLQNSHFSKDGFSIELLPDICMRKTLLTTCMAFTNEIRRSQLYYPFDIGMLDEYLVKYRENENNFSITINSIKYFYSDVSNAISKINSVDMCSMITNQTDDKINCESVLNGTLTMGLKYTISMTEMYVRGLEHLMIVSDTIDSSTFRKARSKYKYSVLSILCD